VGWLDTIWGEIRQKTGATGSGAGQDQLALQGVLESLVREGIVTRDEVRQAVSQMQIEEFSLTPPSPKPAKKAASAKKAAKTPVKKTVKKAVKKAVQKPKAILSPPSGELALIANVDGGSRGNPGPAGAGFVLRTADDNTVLAKVGVYIGRATNNVAEYRGLIESMRHAQTLGATDLGVFTDSQLMAHQINGVYRVKNAALKTLYAEAKQLIKHFDRFRITHIRRELNTAADTMANKAMDQKRTVEE